MLSSFAGLCLISRSLENADCAVQTSFCFQLPAETGSLKTERWPSIEKAVKVLALAELPGSKAAATVLPKSTTIGLAQGRLALMRLQAMRPMIQA